MKNLIISQQNSNHVVSHELYTLENTNHIYLLSLKLVR